MKKLLPAVVACLLLAACFAKEPPPPPPPAPRPAPVVQAPKPEPVNIVVGKTTYDQVIEQLGNPENINTSEKESSLRYEFYRPRTFKITNGRISYQTDNKIFYIDINNTTGLVTGVFGVH
jgi:hypothetical protein